MDALCRRDDRGTQRCTTRDLTPAPARRHSNRGRATADLGCVGVHLCRTTPAYAIPTSLDHRLLALSRAHDAHGQTAQRPQAIR